MNDRSFLLDLKTEILALIIAKLSVSDHLKLREICKFFEKFINKDMLTKNFTEINQPSSIFSAIQDGDRSLAKYLLVNQKKITLQEYNGYLKFITNSLSEIDEEDKNRAIYYQNERNKKEDYRWNSFETYGDLMNQINSQEERLAQINLTKTHHLLTSKKLLLTIKESKLGLAANDKPPISLLKKFGLIESLTVKQEKVTKQQTESSACTLI